MAKTSKNTTDLVTYVSGYATIEKNIVASKIPTLLVIQKKIIISGQNRPYFKEIKKVKGYTSPSGKYDFNISLPEGEYYMYVKFIDERIGQPDAYSYYGITNKINLSCKYDQIRRLIYLIKYY